MGLCIIGANDIFRYVRQRDAILVDLRSGEAYRDFHIRGAVSVPAEQLPRFMKLTDKNRVHIFYCQHGSQSIQAGKIYARRGYNICSVAGGIDSYLRMKANDRTG
ncbi:MAG: rhodanese-like domain-containing protein [Clostridiales bacterium]|nr:rhodanese-like domain-containing protein [Clostridiales bacterium]